MRRGGRRRSGLRGRTAGTAVVAGMAVLLTAACGGDDPSTPPGPVPGTVVVTLEGAVAEDRAVLLEVGGEVAGLSPGSDGLEMGARQGNGVWRVAAFGNLPGSELVRVQVSDTTSLPTVLIREVATATGELRGSLGGYDGRVRVVR